MSEDLPPLTREYLWDTLMASGFIDPDDGTVAMWPNGDDGGVVWVRASRLCDTVLANIGGHLPPPDLPATLASVDDVRRVCEAAGLSEWQSHPASKLTMRWGTAEQAIVGMHYDRNQVLVWQPGIALVPVTVPLQWPAVVLYAAIQAARSAS